MTKRVLTGMLTAGALALGVLAPTAASAATAQDGGWTFTGDTWPNNTTGAAACGLVAFYNEKIHPRDYDCHWAVPLKASVIGLWYR
ncbi:hypothetical protein ACWGE0_26460 [Lentzea sp. NPDC054927]